MVLMPHRDTAPGGKRRLVRAAAAVVLAVGVLVPAGGSATAATGAPPGAAPSLTRYDTIAVQTLDSIVNGDFTAATARFDPTVRKLLPPDALARAWVVYQDQMGRYRSHGGPMDTSSGTFTVVSVPLSMERRAGEFRVTFHEDMSIAGLFFLPAGFPIA
ncbi:hypothetical protein GCM10010425_82060 [Streptomyces spororaveus]|uniref:DUF3887 domain-containing protein n=2 Tax=Streptomyces TaxID=1883 RepID=A0ABQ3T8Q8_9ACTN|nr:hypothetical protein Sspor_23150 [Streptomyces spororaveus]